MALTLEGDNQEVRGAWCCGGEMVGKWNGMMGYVPLPLICCTSQENVNSEGFPKEYLVEIQGKV